jgi:hypothetical protein
MQRVRCNSQRWLALLLVSAIAMMAIPAAQAYTDPNNCKQMFFIRCRARYRAVVSNSSSCVAALYSVRAHKLSQD